MLADAIRQLLKANGLAPVYLTAFADYSAVAAPSWAVTATPDGNVEFTGGAYAARVQIRTRAADAIAAENAGRQASDILLAVDGQTIAWDDTSTPPHDRSYTLEAISIVNRPTWYPTPEAGEETSCNFEMFVTEV